MSHIRIDRNPTATTSDTMLQRTTNKQKQEKCAIQKNIIDLTLVDSSSISSDCDAIIEDDEKENCDDQISGMATNPSSNEEGAHSCSGEVKASIHLLSTAIHRLRQVSVFPSDGGCLTSTVYCDEKGQKQVKNSMVGTAAGGVDDINNDDKGMTDEEPMLDIEQKLQKEVTHTLKSITNLLSLFPPDKRNHTTTRKVIFSEIDEAKRQIRTALSEILNNTGFENSQLLEWIMIHLPSLSNATARSILLEFLPYFMISTQESAAPVTTVTTMTLYSSSSKKKKKKKQADKNYYDANVKQFKTREAEIISILKSILEKDSSTTSLVPILTFLTRGASKFFQSNHEVKKQTIEFFILALTVASSNGVPLVIESMLSYLSADNVLLDYQDDQSTSSNMYSSDEDRSTVTKDDINSRAIEVIRQFFISTEDFSDGIKKATKRVGLSNNIGDVEQETVQERKDYDLDYKILSVFLPVLVKCPIIAKEYNYILKRHFSCKDDKSGDPVDERKSASDEQECEGGDHNWTTLDIIAILILFHYHPLHRKELEEMIHRLCRERMFPFTDLTSCIIQGRIFDSNIAASNLPQKDSMHSWAVDQEPRNYISKDILYPALIEFGLYLLLMPIRHTHHESHRKKLFKPRSRMRSARQTLTLYRCEVQYVLSEAQKFITSLYPILSEHQKNHLVASVLELSSPTNFIESLLPSPAKDVDSAPNSPYVQTTTTKKRRRNETRTEEKPNNWMDSIPAQLKHLLPRNSLPMPSQKHQIRNIYDTANAALWIFHSIINLDSNLDSNFAEQYNQIFTDRVLNFASNSGMKMNRSTRNDEAFHNDGFEIQRKKYDFCLANLNCSILVTLITLMTTKQKNEYSRYRSKDIVEGGTKLMMILQKLFFTSPADVPSFHRNVNRCTTLYGYSRPVGFLLAKHLLRSPSLSSNDREEIIQWALRILLPPLSRNGVVENHVDPFTGYRGVKFLWSLCCKETRKDEENDDVEDSSHFEYSALDVFKQLKAIVARIGLVQLESTMKNKHDILAYEKVPSYCASNGHISENLMSRRMVFCIASFLRVMNANVDEQGCSIFDWAKYVNFLVFVYLKVGRLVSASKWSPNSWLLAKVELPHFPLHLSGEGGQGSSTSSIELETDNLIWVSATSDQGTGAPSPSSIETLRAYAVSISVLHAVECNSFEHYQSILKDGKKNATKRINDILNLIRFNRAKIYGLQHRYAMVVNMISSLQSNRSLTSSPKKLKMDPQLLIKNTPSSSPLAISNQDTLFHRSNLSQIMSCLERVMACDFEDKDDDDTSTPLWACIRTIDNDDIVKQCNKEIMSFAHSDREFFIRDKFRENWHTLIDLLTFYHALLKNLSEVICQSIESYHRFIYPNKYTRQDSRYLHNIFNEEKFGTILESLMIMIPWLTPLLQAYEKNPDATKNITTESSAYSSVRKFILKAFPLLIHIIRHAIFLNSTSANRDQFALSMFSNVASVRCVTEEERESISTRMIGLLSLCHDSVVKCQILDFLSIVATRQQKSEDYLQKVYWGVLLSDSEDYPSISDCVKIPQSLVVIILKYCGHAGDNQSCDKVVKETLLSLLKCGLETPCNTTVHKTLCHSVLSHWGIAGGVGLQLLKDLQHMADALQFLLSKFIETGSSPAQDEDHMNLSTVQISALDGETFPLFYAILLNETIASFALSDQHFISKKDVDKSTTSNSQDKSSQQSKLLDYSPYTNSKGFVCLFQTLINLYDFNINLFQKEFLSVTIQGCFSMINACEYQVKKCIQFQSNDTLSSPMQPRRGTTTPATPQGRRRRRIKDDMYRTSFLTCMKSNCVECILSFCENIKSQDENLTNEEQKSIATLMSRSHKLLDSLHATSVKHHLLPSSLETLGVLVGGIGGASDGGRRRRRNEHSVTKKTIRKKVHANSNTATKSSKTNNIDDSERILSGGKPLELPLARKLKYSTSDDGSDSDSFGVTGDWGDD